MVILVVVPTGESYEIILFAANILRYITII